MKIRILTYLGKIHKLLYSCVNVLSTSYPLSECHPAYQKRTSHVKIIKIFHNQKNCQGEHSVITVTGVQHWGFYLEQYSYIEWKQHFIFDALELTRNNILMARSCIVLLHGDFSNEILSRNCVGGIGEISKGNIVEDGIQGAYLNSYRNTYRCCRFGVQKKAFLSIPRIRFPLTFLKKGNTH